MQSLFEWDFNGGEISKIDPIVKRNIEQFAPGLEDASFIGFLVGGVLKKRKKIDAIIEKAAPEWPINQIAIVDRNVLRIGLFELLFSNKKEVPRKVAINEAIELAKTFGGDSSGKFVNGVLGTVFREIGEPEDFEPKEKKTAKMAEEKLSGAVIYRKEKKEILFALVHDVFGYWTLSKGHIKTNEDQKMGAKREIMEETGLSADIGEEIGVNEYTASDPEKGKVKKIVTYFLASTKDVELKLKKTGGLDDIRWFKLKELADIKMYDEIRSTIARAIKILHEKNKLLYVK